jgi:hypothetical protein
VAQVMFWAKMSEIAIQEKMNRAEHDGKGK